MSESQKNVLGEKLELCGKDPMTGFLRDVAVIPIYLIEVRIQSAQ